MLVKDQVYSVFGASSCAQGGHTEVRGYYYSFFSLEYTAALLNKCSTCSVWGGWSIIVTIKLDTLGGTFRAIVALKYDFYVVEYDKILVT